MHQTELFETHQALEAKMVPFAGFSMPIHYGSQMEEHHAVRKSVGMFDVSHMMITDISGDDAVKYLRQLLANDISKLKLDGQGLYSVMCNRDGGVIDDLIIYRLDDANFRMVSNAGTRERVRLWLDESSSAVSVQLKEQKDYSIIAVQGPRARAVVSSTLFPEASEELLDLERFHCLAVKDAFVARTGYTGEDGFEVMMPSRQVKEAWQKLISQKVQPCGLGARDTLRLEAGYNLSGQDMDELTSPLDAGLGWTIAWGERDFNGKSELQAQREAGTGLSFSGVVLTAKGGIMRNGQRLFSAGEEIGVLTSGGFGPTVNASIGLARHHPVGAVELSVEIRGKRVPAMFHKPPFVRNGQAALSL